MTTAVGFKADSFKRRQIEVEFHIKNPDGTSSKLEVTGTHRIRATITQVGMEGSTQLKMSIAGMTLQNMNKLSYIAGYTTTGDKGDKTLIINLSQTTVVVKAGNYGEELPAVFSGTITEAYADYKASPDVVFRVSASVINAISQSTPADVHYDGAWAPNKLIQDLCTRYGCRCVDHGGWGSIKLTNQYVDGSFLDQIRKVIGNVRGAFDFQPSIGGMNDAGSLHIWGPQWQGKGEANTPLISKATGMIGYPEYTASGCFVACVFRSDIGFFVPIKIKSDYLPAGWTNFDKGTGTNGQGQLVNNQTAPWDGLWIPKFITHDISSETSGGPWHTYIECYRGSIGETNVQFTGK